MGFAAYFSFTVENIRIRGFRVRGGRFRENRITKFTKPQKRSHTKSHTKNNLNYLGKTPNLKIEVSDIGECRSSTIIYPDPNCMK